MCDLGELRWFLNIRVIHDRPQRKLWLCQDSYVEKIVKKFNLEHGAKAYTPLSLPRSEFIKYDGKATPHAYQERIGPIIYPSIITRIDIAAAASLRDTKLLALNIRPEDVCKSDCDAAFALWR
jgi:hypothetical protein